MKMQVKAFLRAIAKYIFLTARKNLKTGDRLSFCILLLNIFQFQLLYRFVYMSCFNILQILKCDSHSQFSNSQLSSRIVYLLCISELSGSISNNTDRQYIFSTNTSEIVVCLTHIPQFFCTPREQSSSEFFWCISSHQLLVAIKIQYQGKLILDFTTIVG